MAAPTHAEMKFAVEKYWEALTEGTAADLFAADGTFECPGVLVTGRNDLAESLGNAKGSNPTITVINWVFGVDCVVVEISADGKRMCDVFKFVPGTTVFQSLTVYVGDTE